MGKIAQVTLVGTSPYSQSKPHDADKRNKELPKDYEERTWKERMHVNTDGQVFIPAIAFKNCISEAAQYLSIKVPGKNNSTYTKHFEAGVSVVDNAPLYYPPDFKEPILKEQVRGDWVFVPSNGVRGAGKRVWKCYPVIDQWITTIEFFVIDDTITESVFWSHLEQAGYLIGIGRFRSRNRGTYGKFKIEEKSWKDMTV